MKNYWLQKKYKGFPQDDEFSIHCHDGGSANLDIFYSSLFVQNETVISSYMKDRIIYFQPFECTPVLPGTVTGTIWDGSKEVQTLCINSSGLCSLAPILDQEIPDIHVERLIIEWNTGEIVTEWNIPPAYKTTLVVSYEYNRG